ncbi:MAG: YybS family protein [Mahellales bacterium]
MNKRQSLGSAVECVLLGVVSSAIAILLFFIPLLNFVIFLWPIPIIVLSLRRGIKYGILAVIISSLICGLFIHPMFGLGILLIFGSTAFTISWAMKREVSPLNATVFGAIAMIISIMIAMKLVEFSVGHDLFVYYGQMIKDVLVEQQNDGLLQNLTAMYRQMGITTEGVTMKDLYSTIDGMVETIKTAFPSILTIFSLICSFINYSVASWLLKRRGQDVRLFPSFGLWKLPRGAGRGFIAILIIAYIGNAVGINNFDIVLLTITNIWVFVFGIQGLSVAEFFLKKANINKALRIVILLLVFILASQVAAFIGFIDQLLNVRRLYDDKNITI